MQLNKLENIINFKGQQNSCPFLFLLFFLTFTASCNKKKSSHINTDHVSKNGELEVDNYNTPITIEDSKKTRFKTFVDQAKENDISTPVGYRLIKSDSKIPGMSFFVYKGESSVDSVVKFYTHELEISGWVFKNLSTQQEGLFVASKVSKTGVISIRPQKLDCSKICITVADENQQEISLTNSGEINGSGI